MSRARTVDRPAARPSPAMKPIASPASRRCGIRRWPATRCSTSAGRRRLRRCVAGSLWLRRAAGADHRRRLDGTPPGVRPGRLAVPVRESALPRSRRHRRRGDGDGSRRAPSRHSERTIPRRPSSARTRMGAGHAEQQRRLGRLRRRQHSEYLNHIPFADHGALLDPPDGRRDRALRQHARAARRRRAIAPRSRRRSRSCAAQERDGRWYGRWGMNYVYGTWSVLCAFNAAGVDSRAPEVRRGGRLARLASRTPTAAGASSGSSYDLDYRGGIGGRAEHRLADGLGAARVDGGRRGRAIAAVARGVDYLIATQGDAGLWPEPSSTPSASRACSTCAITATRSTFPLWALARYRNLQPRRRTPRSASACELRARARPLAGRRASAGLRWRRASPPAAGVQTWPPAAMRAPRGCARTRSSPRRSRCHQLRHRGRTRRRGRPGTWLVAAGSSPTGGRCACRRGVVAALAARLRGAVRRRRSPGADAIVADAAGQASAGARHRRRAPSTRSRTVAAAFAAAPGLPFAVFRVIADPADRRARRRPRRCGMQARTGRSTTAQCCAPSRAAGAIAAAAAQCAAMRAGRCAALVTRPPTPWTAPGFSAISDSF